MNETDNVQEIKRLNYFEGQHLRVTDFEAEQNYHGQMRHLHNRVLHTWGVADGLEVNKNDSRNANIKKGMAIDVCGREIVVPKDQAIDIPKGAGATEGDFYLAICYREDCSNVTIIDKCASGFSRKTESFRIAVLRELPPTWDSDKIDKDCDKIGKDCNKVSQEGSQEIPWVPLAKITLENCKITEIDNSIRSLVKAQFTGSVRIGGDTMTGPLVINRSGVIESNENAAPFTPAKRVDFLHLVAHEDVVGEREQIGYISTNKNTIGLRSIDDFNNPEKLGQRANLKVGSIFADGNVGIGTADRLSRLTVKGRESFSASGTVSVSQNSPIVTGLNTSFLRQVGFGDRIKISDAIRTVTAIANDTSLTVDANFTIEKSGETMTVYPSLFRVDDAQAAVRFGISDLGNIGIGTITPAAKLQVSGGAIMPAVGNHAAAGIQFPSDPGGGLYDEAFIRYFPETGETTKLLIGCGNDADDRISFWQFGAERLTIYDGKVGIGTQSPKEELHIGQTTGNVAIRLGDFNTGDWLLARSVGNNWPSGSFGIQRVDNPKPDLVVSYNGKVGIGIDIPEQRLQVEGSALINAGTPAGATAGLEVRGTRGTYGPSVRVNNGSQWWDIVSWSDNSLKFVKGTGATFTPLTIANNSFQDALVLAANGVGIGTTDINFTLEVNGSAGKPGGGFWSDSSDIRLKKNVNALKGVLDKLLKLRGVSYEWKEPEKHGNLTGKLMGLIAQEVEEVFPEWVGTDSKGYKTLTIIGLEALTVEALREIKDEIDSLKDQYKQLGGKSKVSTQKPKTGE